MSERRTVEQWFWDNSPVVTIVSGATPFAIGLTAIWTQSVQLGWTAAVLIVPAAVVAITVGFFRVDNRRPGTPPHWKYEATIRDLEAQLEDSERRAYPQDKS